MGGGGGVWQEEGIPKLWLMDSGAKSEQNMFWLERISGMLSFSQ